MWQKPMQSIAALATVAMLVLAGCGDDPGGLDLPGAPSNIGLSVDTASITVSWTAGSGADSHEVVLTAPGEDDREETVAATDTTATFEDLTPGATYTATVSAVNGAGRVSGPAVSTIVESDVAFVSNDILEDVTWTKDYIYVLQGVILVGEDVGADANRSLPDGARSGRPDPDSVIVFASDQPRGQRNNGDWGGLVINGRAPVNSGAETEGVGAPTSSILAIDDTPFDAIESAPTEGYDSTGIAIDPAVVYVVRTRSIVDASGITCRFYAKLEPVTIDIAAATLSFRFLANPNCNSRTLVPGDS